MRVYIAGRRGGEAEREAEAREQYFRFEEDVQNALAGRLIEGTQTNNGSSGGSFRAPAAYKWPSGVCGCCWGCRSATAG